MLRNVKRAMAIAAWVFAGADAAAEPDEEDRAEAARLFQEGRELDESGEIERACKKFEKSYALDPAPGTALNLAVCAEEQKEWRRAWELYDTAANIFVSRSDSRARFA